eukprot:11538927-Alexandrium_andersonii.AAC.1
MSHSMPQPALHGRAMLGSHNVRAAPSPQHVGAVVSRQQGIRCEPPRHIGVMVAGPQGVTVASSECPSLDSPLPRPRVSGAPYLAEVFCNGGTGLLRGGVAGWDPVQLAG